MPIALVAGPVVALIGVVAVFFVLRRKSVEKRSMYSARRSQIEHKVRAARQRTLAPHGHAEKPAETPAEAPAPFAVPPGSQATSYSPAAYEPPPAAPPAPPGPPEAAPAESTWGPTPPGSSPFGGPAAPPYEPAPEQFQTPPEPPAYQQPAYQPPAGEAAWTPAAAPSAPETPTEPAPQPVATPAGGGASWSIVGDTKDTTGGAEAEAGKGRERGPGGSWQLSSGEAPGSDAEEAVKAPSVVVAIAQYAILVVGLVMVLIGVFVMIANSHVS